MAFMIEICPNAARILRGRRLRRKTSMALHYHVNLDTAQKRPNFENMRVVTLNIPDSVEVDDRQLAMLVASKLYEEGKLSLGQAAEVAGLTKRAFAELLGSYNVSLVSR